MQCPSNDDKKPFCACRRYLLRRGSTLEDRDFDGRTALHAAAAAGHANVVRHLLRKRAKARTSSDTGETPLRAAAAAGHFEIVRVLITHYRALIDRTDERGATALHRCQTS